MSHCPDDGLLRSYADREMPSHEAHTLKSHLDGCAICSARLGELHAAHTRASVLLGPAETPDVQAAWRRFQTTQTRQRAEQSRAVQSRRSLVQTINRWWASPRRPLLAGALTLVLALNLLWLPPVRAAADQLLQVFRVQRVVFLPFGEEQMGQLDRLDGIEGQPFLDIEMADEDWEPQTVSSPGEAEGVLGYPLHQPADFPVEPYQREFEVRDRNTIQFEVDVAMLREVLTVLGINDVTLPDALGDGPVRVDMPAHAMTTYHYHYSGEDYTMSLFQGQSPEITLPDGVDMAQLGKALLRVYGMNPVEAEAMSQQIDWSSTLVVPFPTDLENQTVQQVLVNGANGLLIEDTSNEQVLYWQAGDRFYVLTSNGLITPDALSAVAQSVR